MLDKIFAFAIASILTFAGLQKFISSGVSNFAASISIDQAILGTVEIGTAAWILSESQPMLLKRWLLILFGAFSLVATYKTLRGETSCDCFGEVQLPPPLLLVTDVAILALITLRPSLFVQSIKAVSDEKSLMLTNSRIAVCLSGLTFALFLIAVVNAKTIESNLMMILQRQENDLASQEIEQIVGPQDKSEIECVALIVGREGCAACHQKFDTLKAWGSVFGVSVIKHEIPRTNVRNVQTLDLSPTKTFFLVGKRIFR